LNLASCDCIICPINDSDNVATAKGGSHWSLLVYVRNTHGGSFFYLDSARHAGSKNLANAKQVAKILQPVISPDVLASGNPTRFVELECPQQQNGYDCGVYTILFAELVYQLDMHSVPDVEELGRSLPFDSMEDPKSIRARMQAVIAGLQHDGSTGAIK
jgi:Ulp1 family protease